MFRPNGFADLAGLDVGIWGIGVEGEATIRRLGDMPRSVTLVDDVGNDARGILETNSAGLAALRRCHVVLKSPGIARRRPDVTALEASGVVVTSALNLWLNESDRSRVIGVTGTKGKSTTTSLITFILRILGASARSAGNIGAPPYDPLLEPAEWTTLEISSFQSVDLDCAPANVVVTSLGADHLDWHGTLMQYHHDKLSVTRATGEHHTFVADSESLRSRRELLGGDVHFVTANHTALSAALGLLGRHNASNVSLALAVSAMVRGREIEDIESIVLSHASTFTPLPGRLTLLATLGNTRYVDDGLATSPLPTMAALEAFDADPVALIVGGYDRGVDYEPLAHALAQRGSPTFLIAMPDVGERIARVVRAVTPVTTLEATSMFEAVTAAKDSLGERGGVVLLSPAAPSFGHYVDWRARSADFTNVVEQLTR